MDIYVVIGTIMNARGKYSEFWIEGFTKDDVVADHYAERMNRVHDSIDDGEQVMYSVMPVYELDTAAFSEYLDEGEFSL